MKRFLLVTFCFILLTSRIDAQFFYDAGPLDSFVIKFTSDTIHNYLPDTATIPLWQIGHTNKIFFTNDTDKTAIMTDTVNHYPASANNWFVLKIPHISHTLISFWHRYQTDSSKDGGTVEYSVNHGITWNNVKDSCNIDGSAPFMGILTANFYTLSDTLLTGEHSFSGRCSTSKCSQFEFAGGPGQKLTSGPYCNFYGVDTFYIRFRFISDTIPDTLAGWFIDSVKVNYYAQSGGIVNRTPTNSCLKVLPNPSSTGTFSFPPLKNEQLFTIDVYNGLGQKVLNAPYRHTLDISHLPQGLYFYKVTYGTEYYSDRLLYE